MGCPLTKVGELVPGQMRAHAVCPLALALVDPARGVGGETHAVTNDQDDVPGHPGVVVQLERLLQLPASLLQPVGLGVLEVDQCLPPLPGRACWQVLVVLIAVHRQEQDRPAEGEQELHVK